MKRGQVTIFIIVGILLVVGIIAILIFSNRVIVAPQVSEDPRSFVRSCVSDLVEDSLEKIMMNGGVAIPSFAISYQGDEWNYLCHQADYYLSCYNFHPMLEEEMESEIVRDTAEGIRECFDSMRLEFEDRGYDISGEATVYSVDLLPGFIEINIEKDILLSSDDSSKNYNDFGFEMFSSAYDLVSVARLIVNDESQFCNFEYNGYMLLYPKYDIRRIDYKDNKLYQIMDRKSGEKFRLAIKSCSFPPGI